MKVKADRKTRPRSGKRTIVEQSDYERLSEFRYLIRCFLEFSQTEAKLIGLAPKQHQALLAIKGFPGGRPTTIGELAERLRIRHHSGVELVDRLCEAGMLSRDQDPSDHRRVLIRLTPQAEELLSGLSAVHLDELDRIEPMLRGLLKRKV